MIVQQYYKKYYCPYCGSNSLKWYGKGIFDSIMLRFLSKCKNCGKLCPQESSRFFWLSLLICFALFECILFSMYFKSIFFATCFLYFFIIYNIFHELIVSVLFRKYVKYKHDDEKTIWANVFLNVSENITNPKLFFTATSTLILVFDGDRIAHPVNIKKITIYEKNKIFCYISFIQKVDNISSKFILKEGNSIVAEGGVQ